MITPDEVRRLTAVIERAVDTCDERQLSFHVDGRGFAWSFKERVHPKQPRAPRLDVLAVRCPMARKEFLIEVAPDRFFDDPHYRGYPAVLVRLDVVEADELAALLADAARLVAAAKPRKPRKRST
ncbi:MAG: MmcQ/YjbR family DNA-binding protein [Proteobacteria bacterium]|nr:MmcQ/YjbR family DNA-binding protein [Pseudomonadota bacterium]